MKKTSPSTKEERENFYIWRKINRITLQNVAKQVGCNASTICRWENGKIDLYYMLLDKIYDFKNNYKGEM